MPKFLKYLLLVLAVPVTVAFAWNVLARATDPDLDPEFQALMREFDEPLPGNGYYALLGLGRIGATPIAEVGEKIVDAEKAGRGATVLKDLGIEFEPIPVEPRAMTCGNEQAGRCLAHAAAQRAAVQDLNARMAARLGEYQTLYDYAAFRYPTLPSFDSTLPPFQMALFCSALLRTQAALLVLDDKVGEALPLLARDIEFWRRLLGQPQLGVVDKMVAVAGVQLHAAFYSELLREKRLSSSVSAQLAAVLGPLNAAERAFFPSMQVEAGSIARGTLNQDDEQLAQLASEMLDAPRWTGSLLGRALYQPHATVNRLFRRARAYAGVDALTGADVKARLATANETFEPRDWAQRWFNLAGSRYEEAASPSYVDYVLRLHDLDGYLRAVGLQARIAAERIPDPDIPELIAQAGAAYSDPFDGAPMRWDAIARTLTFSAQGQRVQALLPLKL